MLFRVIFSISILLLVQWSYCQNGAWQKELSTIGTLSSPRCIDLNQDGILDIVMGAGRAEFQECDSAVIALDGRNGTLLWHAPGIDQIFGSPIFLPITDDSIPDVVIGGRSAELMAIDGSNGQVIWNFRAVNEVKKPGKKSGWYNFYNPQIIPDQDGDGIKDLIVSNGGDVTVEPYDPNRPPGHLVVISSRNGAVLAKARMPDDKEIYMSITLYGDEHNPSIVFGTGGETIGGNLWVCTLSDVLTEDLSSATLLDSSANKGYIAPSAIVDINGDKQGDIITNSVDGRLLAFDGKSKERIWELEIPTTESYGSVAVGHFDADGVLDFFLSNARGVWPDLGWSVQKMISGKDGTLLFTDSLGFYQNTSAVAYDLNVDGLDEVIFSVNIQQIDEIFQKFFYTLLMVFDFSTGKVERLSNVYEGNNFSSTPWIGDLDKDGFLDIIYCHGTNLRHTYTFDGIKVRRLTTKFRVYKPVRWGSYQGSNYDGIYKK